MAILGWIIIGLIAGALAKLIMPGDDPGGIIVTILIGIAGAIVGGWLASLIGIGGGIIITIITATIGAIILLAIYRAIAGRRTAR
ncbi:MAG: GlsB/YeaQ/YmgE family stress response membrane protein [Rubrobacter sp.]|nr:GlsB/YeaQ/YmgE family stress response membrane protein [Rubrobacter sp.]